MSYNTRNARPDDRYSATGASVRRPSSGSRTEPVRSRTVQNARRTAGSSAARPGGSYTGHVRSGARHSDRPAPRSASRPGTSAAHRSAPARSSPGNRRPPYASDNVRTASGKRPPSANRPSANRPSAGRRPNPARRPVSRAARRRRRQYILAAIVILAVLLAVGGYFLHVFNYVGAFHPTYVKNIYVNGESFAGSSKEEGVAIARTIEDEWLNESFVFRYQDYSWPFTRASVDADIGYENQLEYAWNLGHIGSIFERKRVIDMLAENPVYLESPITYSEDKIDAFVDEICAAIDVAPVDAVVVPDANAPLVITESSTGLQVNREQLREQIVHLIEYGDGDTAIPVDTLFPTVSSDQLSFQTIAEVQTTTAFRGYNSRTNVRLALNAFNGMVVQPGEQCDFNDIVGPRTKERGYKKAVEYDGDTTIESYGGGVCQASTTLYQALVKAGITVLEREQHNMTVAYADPSTDAAVSYGDKNLIFKNNTDYPIYIYTSVTSEWASVTIYGHRPDYRYEIESVIIESGIQSTRKQLIEDTTGTHVFYKDDPPVLAEKGKDGCTSEGWLVAYDWETGAEVSRTLVDRDYYKPGVSTYWVGVHDRNTVYTAPSVNPTY